MLFALRRWTQPLRQWVVDWLVHDLHLRGVKFGENSIEMSPSGVGDVLRWSGTQAAVGAGDLGMNVGTGRPSAYVGGAAEALAILSETALAGVSSSIDNALPRFDSTTGKVLQGGVASNNVILSDAGDLYPEANNGGALGVTSTNMWSGLFLANLSVVDFNNGDIVIQHSSDQLRFQSAGDGYRFEDGPVHLEGIDNPADPANGYGMVYANVNSASGQPRLAYRQSSLHSPANSLETALNGLVGNCVLDSVQLEDIDKVRQATIFMKSLVADFDTTHPDAISITNGITTETWTAVAGSPSAFQFQTGGLVTSMQNLATAINNDSTLWSARWYNSTASGDINWPEKHAGFNGGFILIWRTAQAAGNADDRIYGDVAVPGAFIVFDFSNATDYRDVANTSLRIQMPSTDSGTRQFGYGSQDRAEHGTVVYTLLDRKQWFLDDFNQEWIQVGGTIGAAEGVGTYVPYIQSTTAKTATFTGVLGETHLVDTSGGGFTCNLPAIASGQGRIGFYFSGTGGQLTVDPNSSETVEGKTTIKLQQGHNTIENDGTEWKLVQKSGRSNTRLDPAQITSNQNNYNPTDWGRDVTHLYFDTDAERTITGFEEGGFVGMDSVIVVNDGSENIVIAHDSASSTAANRVLIEAGFDATIEPDGVAELVRDGTVNKWRLRLPGRHSLRSDTTQTAAQSGAAFPLSQATASFTGDVSVNDYDDIDVYLEVLTLTGGVTEATVFAESSGKASPAADEFATLQSDDAISAGAVTLSDYLGKEGTLVADGWYHWNFPSRGATMRFGVFGNAVGGTFNLFYKRNVRS